MCATAPQTISHTGTHRISVQRGEDFDHRFEHFVLLDAQLVRQAVEDLHWPRKRKGNPRRKKNFLENCAKQEEKAPTCPLGGRLISGGWNVTGNGGEGKRSVGHGICMQSSGESPARPPQIIPFSDAVLFEIVTLLRREQPLFVRELLLSLRRRRQLGRRSEGGE